MKLKPCPFCGGEAEIEIITTSVMDAVRKSVGCNTEGCQGYQSNATFATEKEAAEAWNERPPRAASIIRAAENMDWMQVVLNQSAPCFHLCDDGRFCGRAERWHWDRPHPFVSLKQLLEEE